MRGIGTTMINRCIELDTKTHKKIYVSHSQKIHYTKLLIFFLNLGMISSRVLHGYRESSSLSGNRGTLGLLRRGSHSPNFGHQNVLDHVTNVVLVLCELGLVKVVIIDRSL